MTEETGLQQRTHREMAVIVEHLRQTAHDVALQNHLRQQEGRCSCCGQVIR